MGQSYAPSLRRTALHASEPTSPEHPQHFLPYLFYANSLDTAHPLLSKIATIVRTTTMGTKQPFSNPLPKGNVLPLA